MNKKLEYINQNLLALNNYFKGQNKIVTTKNKISNNILKQNNSTLKQKITKGFIGKQLSSQNQQLHDSKFITYSFKNNNPYSCLISSTNIIEIILKNFFSTIGTIISKPIYLNTQDKIIIRLFVFLSPKIDLFLNTSLINKSSWATISKSQMKLTDYLNKKDLYKISNLENSSLNKLKIKLIQIDKKLYKKASAFHFRLNLLLSDLNKTAYLSKNSLFKDKRELGLKFLSNLELDNKNNYVSFYTLFNLYLEKFSLIIGGILNKKVEFELIKLQFPFHDSSILSQILGLNADNYSFTRMKDKLLPLSHIKNPTQNLFFIKSKKEDLFESKNNVSLFQPSSYLPSLFSIKGLNSRVVNKINCFNLIGSKGKYNSFLSGMNVRLAGRLITQSLRPKFTVQTIQKGTIARVKVDYLEKSRFTGKNKRGAYSFTVSISHVLNK